MGCVFGLQSVYMREWPTHIDVPRIPGMVCMCHEKEGKGESVYNGVGREWRREWRREWIGGKKSAA
jgi:hypothetical protein